MIGRRAFVRGAVLTSLGVGACAPPESRAAGRVKVALWYSLGGRNREVLAEILRRFHAAQDDVHVEAVYQGDYFEALAKLRTAIAAKAAPALSHVVAEVVPYLAEAGVLEPLQDHVGMRELDLVRPLAQAGAFVGGDARPLWGVPLNRSTPVMYCNAELFARAGVGFPSTWAELLAAARALTVPGERFGYQVPVSWWFWVAMVGQAGGSVWGDGDVPTLGEDAGVRALRFWQDMVHRERVMRPPPGRDYDAWNITNQDFLGGRAAFIWSSSAYVRYLEDNAAFPVVARRLPRDVRASAPTGGTFFVVPRRAPDVQKAAAARFLRFFCAPEQATLLATRTGYLPTTNAAVARLRQEGFYAAHPNDAAVQDSLADVTPWPWSTRLFRVERDVVDPRLEEAVLLDRDASVVLADARRAAARPG